MTRTTVTADTVGGVRVGRRVAAVVDQLSDEYLQDKIPQVEAKVDYTKPLNPFTRIAVAEQKLTERKLKEEFAEKPFYDPSVYEEKE